MVKDDLLTMRYKMINPNLLHTFKRKAKSVTTTPSMTTYTFKVKGALYEFTEFTNSPSFSKGETLCIDIGYSIMSERYIVKYATRSEA